MSYDLNLENLMEIKKGEPKISIPFSLDAEYLKKDFTLDIVVWKLKAENLRRTRRVVRYVLENFNKLFKTAWTALYNYYYNNIQCTLPEFFQMISFDSPRYSIRVEINSDFLSDGAARYHFVVKTEDCLSGDDIRLYMRDNKCCACDTNNDDAAILVSANFEDIYIPEMAKAVEKSFEKQYEKMTREQILLAPPFKE